MFDHQIFSKTKGYHRMTESSFCDSVLMSRPTRTYYRRSSATSDCGHVVNEGNGNYDVQMRCQSMYIIYVSICCVVLEDIRSTE